MRTIMEPMDVNEASPATISRNGMVFFEPHLMGIEPLVEKNFLGSMPEGLDEEEVWGAGRFGSRCSSPKWVWEQVKEVRAMTGWLLKPCIKYIREDGASFSIRT